MIVDALHQHATSGQALAGQNNNANRAAVTGQPLCSRRVCRHTQQNHHRLRDLTVRATCANGAALDSLSAPDVQFLRRAAELADSSAGLTQPHPNAGCVLVGPDGRILSETYQRAQGTESAEAQAVGQVRAATAGATAYLNLESGNCHGDDSAVRSLLQSGVSRVVVGLRHPLRHLRGYGIGALQSAGVQVDVLGESVLRASEVEQRSALQACLQVNEALLHRAAFQKPFGVLKYAMTLDGKIATSCGHAAWISSPASRQRVFETRARSDAVVVGGNTVRRDNPRLTTRREGGHMPVRIVMSRTLDLPEDANLWDVSSGAATIVMTQRGARTDFQLRLRDRGVEVVEFDFLMPEAVAVYCYHRGFLQVLWECGGTLAAPAISGLAIHKVLAFIAPKIVGGVRAPTPVGELGNVNMGQAFTLEEDDIEKIGPDILWTGYLPSAGGLWSLHADLSPSAAQQQEAAPAPAAAAAVNGQPAASPTTRLVKPRPPKTQVAEFYKSWDRYGALSNFSPHAITAPCAGSEHQQQWSSVEHYYQAQKFAGSSDPEAISLVQAIQEAASPEEAARLGRQAQRLSPHLVRPDWDTAKLAAMYAGLSAKFRQHAGPCAMLLSTAAAMDGPLQLVESSPHDYFWGGGHDSTGQNNLGKLLMRLRSELLSEFTLPAETAEPAGGSTGVAAAAASPRHNVLPRRLSFEPSSRR